MEIKKIGMESLDTLQTISIEIFTDTFKEYNTSENLQNYLDKAYNKNQLQQDLENINSEFYFIYVNGDVAGYMKLNIEDAQTEKVAEKAMEVERIYIKKEYQKLGLGKRLILKAMALARKQNKKYIWLGVWEHNTNAMAFYTKMEFIQKGSHDFYMGDEKQTDIIMIKRV